MKSLPANHASVVFIQSSDPGQKAPICNRAAITNSFTFSQPSSPGLVLMYSGFSWLLVVLWYMVKQWQTPASKLVWVVYSEIRFQPTLVRTQAPTNSALNSGSSQLNSGDLSPCGSIYWPTLPNSLNLEKDVKAILTQSST